LFYSVLYEKDVDLVETDLMVQDPGCLLAGVPDLHVIVQVLRQKICIILRSLMVKKTMPIYSICVFTETHIK
jgi:hypothetical protein